MGPSSGKKSKERNWEGDHHKRGVKRRGRKRREGKTATFEVPPIHPGMCV